MAVNFLLKTISYSAAASQVPPKIRPGPSDARKIGLRAARGQALNICRAACRAAPHVEEPRLPAVRAMGGNASAGTPVTLARSESRRGLG